MGKSITSIPEHYEDQTIVFSNGTETAKISYDEKGNIYVDTNRYDKTFNSGNELAKWLNNNNFEYQGVDDK